MVGDAGEVHPSAAELDDEQHIDALQEDRVDGEKSQATIPAACWRRNDLQLVGAPGQDRGSTRLIELADTRQPRRSSSPWIRW